MANGHVLSLAISGLRFSGRTELYQQLELVLPKDESLRECEFAFLGNPFGHLRHPLQWVREGHKKHGLSRLFECWGMLNEFTEELWMPALKTGKIPVMDGCGLDAVLYATACIECPMDHAKVMDWHHELVHDRIVKQGVSPPRYLITRADPQRLLRGLREKEIVDAGVNDHTILGFIDKERTTIVDYFRPGSGQQTPYYLPALMSTETMVTEAVMHIRRAVRTRVAA